jgi:hypothetical protein
MPVREIPNVEAMLGELEYARDVEDFLRSVEYQLPDYAMHQLTLPANMRSCVQRFCYPVDAKMNLFYAALRGASSVRAVFSDLTHMKDENGLTFRDHLVATLSRIPESSQHGSAIGKLLRDYDRLTSDYLTK